MRSKLNALIRLYSILPTAQNLHTFFSNASPFKPIICCPRFYVKPVLAVREDFAKKLAIIRDGTDPPVEVSDHVENIATVRNRKSSEEVSNALMRWGCTEHDVSIIFLRNPSLRNMTVKCLQSKLQILRNLGICSSDLVKIMQCRPRFLSCRLSTDLEERIEYLLNLFGSREILLKAILRNPSLLNYDLHGRMKLVVATYESVGVSRDDLIPMLLSRPTLIPRCVLDDEKMDYIRRTGVSKDSKMYKYVVTIFSVSRTETICEKIANLEKFGFSKDEVLKLFGRNPFILTFSTDKVQRNMTFICATMKLPAKTVLDEPFLLCKNLETWLRPRFFLGQKIDDMDLAPRVNGPVILTALRMTEKRFIKAFINCHPEAVAEELIMFYKSAKCIKRIAGSSKKCIRYGFPF
ncbi:OLC1v1037196C1 [Oldenlandia corymbosa var. corymbosa]|uniref:OLC1v1037196C1 n=1 Tax=Oldenlandia corymbosa var. corymbosa TaxID=529605 RepID=A0AAV1D0A1_OLDCO|nr:OLC1v1037196C1 [Oldenlandia corymbosa var. corymbosa]